MKKNIPLYCFLLTILYLLPSLTIGQTSTYHTKIDPVSTFQYDIPAVPTNQTPITQPFSPSITTYTDGSTKKLICAYAFRRPSPHEDTRAVGFSHSVASGTPDWQGDDWEPHLHSSTEVLLPMSGFDNLDDPQLLCIGGEKLVCVVRAWAKSHSGNAGDPVSEQSYSIYTHSAILLFVSTDGGETWGHFNGSGFWENTGDIVDEANGDETSTLEYPRISFRSGFTDKGYVTWQKKWWHSGTDGLRVSFSQIGLVAFRADDSNLPGKIFPRPSGISKYLTIFGTSTTPSSGSDHYDDNYNVSGGFIAGPERPSVAVAPDSSVWLSFYKVKYRNLPSGKDWDGVTPPNANWLITRVITSINTSGQSIFNVDEPETFATNAPIFGVYDNTRGYFYNSDWMPDYPVDMASGPSVQVAVNEPLGCQYTVGVLTVSGKSDISTSYQSDLNFYSARLVGGSNASNWNAKKETVDHLEENESAHTANCYANTNFGTMRFFPILKYVDATDNYLNKKVFDLKMNSVLPMIDPQTMETNSLPRSYFVAGYMRGYRLSTFSSGNKVTTSNAYETGYVYPYEELRCKTAISFDNKKFTVANTNSSTNSFIRNAQENGSGCIYFVPVYLGTKMDIDGTNGSFEYQVVWHDMTTNNIDDNWDHEALVSNRAGCILAKPLLTHFAGNDPEAAALPPSGTTSSIVSLLYVDQDGGSSPIWSTYAYCQFRKSSGAGYIDQPTKMTASETYVEGYPNGVPGLTMTYGNTGNSFNGSASLIDPVSCTTCTTAITPGIYYSNYEPEDDYNFGNLGFSNQRKFVNTANYIHAVFERDNKIYYSQAYAPDPTSPKQWTPPIYLSSSSSEILASRPCIAVYQRGNGNGFCGETAIAVTWVEVSGVSGLGNENLRDVRIWMRTREMNLCEGFWPEWSDPYVIHEHRYFIGTPVSNSAEAFGEDDKTTPVIVPHVAQISPATEPIPSTYLLGWTITWSSPKLAFNSGTGLASFGDTTAASCGKFLKSGLYSRTWLRTFNPVGTTYNVLTSNQHWGEYPLTGWFSASSYKGLQPTNTISPPWNVLTTANGCSSMHPISFPTVLSTEHKLNGSSFMVGGTTITFPIRQEIMFSNDGTDKTKFGNIWELQANYYTTGSTIGALNGSLLPPVAIDAKAGIGPNDYWDRNPSLCVASSGWEFAAWERMRFEFSWNSTTRNWDVSGLYSDIVSGTTPSYSSYTSWFRTGVAKILSTNTAGSDQFIFLTNPSITAFPKTHLNNHFIGSGLFDILDQDPEAVEISVDNHKLAALWGNVLQFGGVGTYAPPTGSPISRIGIWQRNNNWPTTPSINSQRSIGMYESGPGFSSTSDPVNGGILGSSAWGRSFVTANSCDATFHLINTSPFTFITGSGGTFYKGTFDTNTNTEFYRIESRIKNSTRISFTWGGVHVGDSSSLPNRQVILYTGHIDTTLDQIRDSVFRTEIFNWPNNTEVTMFRTLSISDTSATSPGGTLVDTSFKLHYTIELVDLDHSEITAIEDLTFSPYEDSMISPKTIKITNNSSDLNNVYLRVRATHYGLSNSLDSGMIYLQEMDTCQSSPTDTIMNFYKTKAIYSSLKSKLEIYPIYPNPIQLRNTSEFSLALHQEKGHLVLIELVDLLGRKLYEQKIESTGTLQAFRINSPQSTGVYFVRVSSGNEFFTIPISVTN